MSNADGGVPSGQHERGFADGGLNLADEVRDKAEKTSDAEPTDNPASDSNVNDVKELNRLRTMVRNERVAIGEKMHFVCLTIGTRGDVQPYIASHIFCFDQLMTLMQTNQKALAKRLKKDGHTVTIASHPEYSDWVKGFEIEYRPVGGDPAALMKLSVEHSVFSKAIFEFRPWLDDLFKESWEACQDADVLIQSPSTFAGIHIAEALKIPFFQAFTMPWTKTSAYPQAFSSSFGGVGHAVNLMSYSLFDNGIWTAMAGQVNQWREDTLKLKPTNLKLMRSSLCPFIYNFSPEVVTTPKEWVDNTLLSGYWFLDQPHQEFDLKSELSHFIKKAKTDKVPIIYVGFGSITVPDPRKITNAVYKAVADSGVRAIVAKGWSDRNGESTDGIRAPAEVLVVKSVPHNWLLPQINAACHHGGAGTTGATLKSGLPTIIHPFFGDQHFWANRVTEHGVGLKIQSLEAKELTKAFKTATTSQAMQRAAAALGEKIEAEDGVGKAAKYIYENIPLAKKVSEDRANRVVNRPRHFSGRFSGSRSKANSETTAELDSGSTARPEKSSHQWSRPHISHISAKFTRGFHRSKNAEECTT